MLLLTSAFVVLNLEFPRSYLGLSLVVGNTNKVAVSNALEAVAGAADLLVDLVATADAACGWFRFVDRNEKEVLVFFFFVTATDNQ